MRVTLLEEPLRPFDGAKYQIDEANDQCGECE
jgi:hypothetical protein